MSDPHSRIPTRTSPLSKENQNRNNRKVVTNLDLSKSEVKNLHGCQEGTQVYNCKQPCYHRTRVNLTR